MADLTEAIDTRVGAAGTAGAPSSSQHTAVGPLPPSAVPRGAGTHPAGEARALPAGGQRVAAAVIHGTRRQVVTRHTVTAVTCENSSLFVLNIQVLQFT